jgi:hypothetical protein
VPVFGVARTLLAIGRGGDRGRLFASTARRAAVVTALVLVDRRASGFRFPAVVHDPAHGLVESREGAAVQLRVQDREDGRAS